MNAIYKGKYWKVVDDNGYGVTLSAMDSDAEIPVLYCDPELILDPTDDDVDRLTDWQMIAAIPLGRTITDEETEALNRESLRDDGRNADGTGESYAERNK